MAAAVSWGSTDAVVDGHGGDHRVAVELHAESTVPTGDAGQEHLGALEPIPAALENRAVDRVAASEKRLRLNKMTPTDDDAS